MYVYRLELILEYKINLLFGSECDKELLDLETEKTQAK